MESICGAAAVWTLVIYSAFNSDDAEGATAVCRRAYRKLDRDRRKQDARILVHCQAGISRSASFLIYHLMRSWEMTFDVAFRVVKQARKRINPNQGFRAQLRIWQMHRDGIEVTLSEKRLIEHPPEDVMAEMSDASILRLEAEIEEGEEEDDGDSDSAKAEGMAHCMREALTMLARLQDHLRELEV
jgi:hypothetical protein